MNRDKLIELHPWLTDDDFEVLEEKLWLVPFIEEGDESLDDALGRLNESIASARAELRSKGETPHQRMRTESGLETTSYLDPIEGR